MNARTRKTRRRWGFFWLGFILAIVLLGVYSTSIEPRWLKIERIELTLETLPPELDGLTIAHLTDLHYPRVLGEAFYQRVISTTNALHPDVIVMTGDFICASANDADECARLVAGLKAPLGVYGVLGNHDYWTSSVYVEKEFEKIGVEILRNEAVPVRKNGTRLWVVGADDYWQNRADLDAALAHVPAGVEPTVLLVHEPDYADIASQHPVDLQLSGHSHGGLVWVPGIGAPKLPPYCTKYPRGLRNVNGMWLYTNRGIGVIPIFNIPIRCNARPEIALFTLRARDSATHPPAQP